MELVVTDLAASRAFYVDVLGLYVTEEDEDAIYLRSLEEFIHHNLVLRKGPVAAVAALRLPGAHARGPRHGRGLLQGARLPRRAPRGGLHQGHRRLGARGGPARASPTSSSTTSEHVERLAWRYDLLHRRASSCAWTTSTRSPPTCPRGRDVPGGPRLPRHRGHPGRRGHRLRRVDAPQAHRARHRDDRRRRPAHAPRRVRDPREAQHPRDLRQARRPAHLRPRSSAAPAATASPTRSTSTCATPTGTASRSTRRTTTPATPTTRSSPGTCTTTSAATGGATRSCRPGTPRPPSCSTSTATRSRSSRAPTPSEMAVTIGADGFSYTRTDDAADELPSWKQGEYKLGHQL